MMKKTGFSILFLFASIYGMAQVERKTTTLVKQDPATVTAGQNTEKAGVSKDHLKELDLSGEQKIKLKEIRQNSHAKKQAIENNTQLSDQEKKQQLRQMRQGQMERIQNLLTEEQKAKLREMIKNNSKNNDLKL